MTPPSSNGIYYFLGNITSHILHALPLYRELGGTFIVLSTKAQKEVEKYDVPVVHIDNVPSQWKRFGYKVKPVYHYTDITSKHRKTVEFLNNSAKIVIFYELYNFTDQQLTKPKTIFLTHGNMLKDYMAQNNRIDIMEQYDYMAALGPHLRQQFIKDGVEESKLINLGIARTDEVVKGKNKIAVPQAMLSELSLDPDKKIVSYLPTFWGASSIYTTGLEIIKNIPDNYTLLFRPHPQTPKKLLRSYLDVIQTRNNVIYAPEGKYKHLGLIDIFNASSVIIGDVSSVTLEAILTHKPLVFAYDTPQNRQPESDYTSIAEVVKYSEKIDVDTTIRLPTIIDRAIKNGIDTAVWDTVIAQNFYHADGSSTKAIKDFTQRLL